MSFTSDYLKKKNQLSQISPEKVVPTVSTDLTGGGTKPSLPQADAVNVFALPSKKSQTGGSSVVMLPQVKQSERVSTTLPKVKQPFDLGKALTTPAKSGYFEGTSFLPSSPEEFITGLGYHAERAGAEILGTVEGLTDLGWTVLGKGLHGVLTLGGLLPETPNSEWAESLAEDALNTSPTQAWKDSINRRYQPSVGAQRLGDITGTVASLLPALAAGAAVSAGSSALNAANAASKGAAASKTLFGLQAAGQGAQEAYQEGASTGQALAYGAATGLLEASIESMASGIPGFGKGVVSEIAQKVASNPAVQKALDIAGEGGEEALSAIITPYIKRAMYDADAEMATADEIAQSAVMGMIAAGVLQAGLELPGAVSQAMDTRRGAARQPETLPNVERTAVETLPMVDTAPSGTYDGTTQNQLTGGIQYGTGEEAAAAGQGIFGADVRGEGQGVDTRGEGTYSQTDRTVAADWAKEHIVERPSAPAERAVAQASRYIADVFSVDDKAIKGRNSNAWALTSEGKIYISDSVPAELADVVGYHEVVHAIKQRGDKPYQAFLDQVGGMIDNQSEAADQLLGVVLQSRFKDKQILELSFDELMTAYDELNAVIWGYHKADPENARAQFSGVFQDYDSYIQALDSILERGRNDAGTAQASTVKMLPGAELPPKGGGNIQPGVQMLPNREPGEVELLPMVDSAPEADGVKNTAPTGGAVNENGLTSLTEQERTNLSSGKRNKIVSTFQDAVSFVRNALSDRKNTDRAYLGKVPEPVSQKILEDTGLDVRGFGVMINGDDVRHIMKNHGNPEAEQNRGQLAITPDDIARIPEILSSPDAIHTSEAADGKGRTAIIFEKQLGDYYITIQGISDGKRLLQTDTLYKRRTRTTRDTMPGANHGSVPVINAQGEPPQSSSIISVLPDRQQVNTLSAETEQNDGAVSAAGRHAAGVQMLPNREPGEVELLPGVGPTGSAKNGFDYAQKAESVLNNGIFTGEYQRAFENTGLSYADLNSALTRVSKNDIDSSDPAISAVMSVLDGTYMQRYGPESSVGAARANFTGDTERGFSKNLATDRARHPDIQDDFQLDPEKYFRLSNKKILQKAQDIFSAGLDNARSTVEQALGRAQEGRKLDPEIVPLSKMVADALAAQGDMNGARHILAGVAAELTSAGQLGQAAKILRDADPKTTIESVERIVDNLNDALGGKNKIVVDKALIDEYDRQTDNAGRADVLDQIYDSVASQIPSTPLDKFNALRYTNMLGNIKTQVRNVGGNLIMKGVRTERVKVQAAIEALAQKRGMDFERTTSFTRDREIYKLAKEEFDAAQAEIMGEQKYSYNGKSIPAAIHNRRTIFKNNGTWGTDPHSPAYLLRKGTDFLWKLPEGYRRLTNWAMEKGDIVFAKSAYADALSRYLKANGVTVEQYKSGNVDYKLLERAQAYAVREAQEATFRDSNAFSDMIASIGFRKADTLPKKVVNTALQGSLPYRRTPANMSVRAVEYSPLGLLDTAVKGISKARGNENITSAEVIRSMSKTLTGSGLFAVGAVLGAAGFLSGLGSSDEEEARLDEQSGRQDYAIYLPDWLTELVGLPKGFNFTLDWASPASVPLFMGAELGTAWEENGFQWKDLWTALGSSSNVLLNMSVLQGVDDQLSNISYSEQPLVDLVMNSLTDFITAGLTNTWLGQLERTLEDKRMTTYTDKNLELPTDWQYELGRASSRTPGWDYQQVPYIDAWGREDATGTLPMRAFNNFLNPAYTSSLNVTPVDEEVQRLYNATGDGAVVPERPNKYITVDGERIDLTGEQYVQYATQRGQTAYDLMEDLLDNQTYHAMSEDEQAKAVKSVYEYADALGKSAVSGYTPENWVNQAQAAQQELGLSVSDYLVLRQQYGNAIGGEKVRQAYQNGIPVRSYLRYAGQEQDKDGSGGVNQAEKIAAIEGSGLNDEQKNALYQLEGVSDAGLAKWERARDWGLSENGYLRYYAIYSGDGKKADKLKRLQEAGMTYDQAKYFWDLMKDD